MAAVGGAYEAYYNAMSSAGQAQATANIGAAVGYMNGTLASGKTASDAEADASEAYVGSMAGSFAALVSSVASAATTFSQAASGEMVTYVAASASAVQSLVTTVADAAKTRSDAAADAAKAASDSAVGAINAYVVGMLPASLTAYESIVDSVESWQGTGISTSIAALRAAVDATHTRDVAAANAALTAANAAAAVDDAVTVKQAQRDKAAAILEAIQAKNELEAKDASEFAGMGPGGFFSTVTGYIGGMWDSTVDGIQEFAHWAWNDGLDMATDFTTGWADTLTGGAHARVRQFLGIDDYVNYDSYAYMGGQAVGTVHGFMLGGAAGATAHAGRAYTVARAFTAVETAWSMGEAGVNIYQGDAGLGDALAFAPGAGYIAGRMTDGLSLFKCFVGDTQVVIREADTTPIVVAMPVALPATAGSRDDSGVWLAAAMVPIGIAGSRVLRRRTRRRDSDDAADDDFSHIDGINRDAIGGNRCLELHSQACGAHPAEDFDVEDRTLADLHDQAFCRLDDGVLDDLDASETRQRTSPIIEPVVSPRRPSRRRSRIVCGGSNLLASAWLLGCLLLGGMFFLGQSSSPALSRQATASPAAASPIDTTLSDQKYVTRSIREIRIGDRVLAHNPEVTETERAEAVQPDATWRQVCLEMGKPDGSQVRIQLLRPRSWLTAQAAAVGSTIQLDLEEMGASGPARVTDITSCPPLSTGPGEVVTGTFAHSAGNVIDLSVEGLDRPIGTTDNHPFWSEDRQKFVPAGELRIGERLKTEDGQLLAVTGSTPRRTKESVFNLEVNTEHVYYVSQIAVLTHNQYVDYDGPVFHGTDSVSASSISGVGLDADAWKNAAGGAGVDPKGFSVTTNRATAEAWAKVRAAERGGTPVVLEAPGSSLPLQSGSLDDLADADELFISPDDFFDVGGGIFN